MRSSVLFTAAFAAVALASPLVEKRGEVVVTEAEVVYVTHVVTVTDGAAAAATAAPVDQPVRKNRKGKGNRKWRAAKATSIAAAPAPAPTVSEVVSEAAPEPTPEAAPAPAPAPEPVAEAPSEPAPAPPADTPPTYNSVSNDMQAPLHRIQSEIEAYAHAQAQAPSAPAPASDIRTLIFHRLPSIPKSILSFFSEGCHRGEKKVLLSKRDAVSEEELVESPALEKRQTAAQKAAAARAKAAAAAAAAKARAAAAVKAKAVAPAAAVKAKAVAPAAAVAKAKAVVPVTAAAKAKAAAEAAKAKAAADAAAKAKATADAAAKAKATADAAAKAKASADAAAKAKVAADAAAKAKAEADAAAVAKKTTTTTTPIKASNPTTTSTASTASSTDSSSKPTGIATTYQQAVVNHHNYHRANHSSPDLQWSQKLADTALKIAKTCVWGHNTQMDGGGYGQNIAAGQPADRIGSIISDQFYNGEIDAYPVTFGGEPKFDGDFGKWGHLTQVVWAASTEVGCATYKCGSMPGGASGPYTVCNYGPVAGNLVGAVSKNVGTCKNLPTVLGSDNVDTAAIKAEYSVTVPGSY